MSAGDVHGYLVPTRRAQLCSTFFHRVCEMGPVVFEYPSAAREQDREQRQSSRAADMGGGEAPRAQREHNPFAGDEFL